MVFDPEFKEMMVDSIRWFPFQGTDRYAEDSYAPNATVINNCRVVHKNKRVRTAEGNEVTSSTNITTPGAFGISTKDKVLLPGQAVDAEARPIVSVEQYPDEDGPHHEVVFLA